MQQIMTFPETTKSPAAKSTISLRPYQREAVDAVHEAAQRGIRRPAIALSTGLGKTVCFAYLNEERPGRSLIIAHRDELIQQAVDKYKMVNPNADIGVVKAKQNDTNATVIVASIQTLAHQRRLDQLPRDFTTITVDECFPAGTLIDNQPIESLRVGDYVQSYNHYKNIIEKRRITRTFKSKPKHLVRISFTNGRSIVCTAGHPFFTHDIRNGSSSYVAAIDLSCYHVVQCTIDSRIGEHRDNHFNNSSLPVVWETDNRHKESIFPRQYGLLSMEAGTERTSILLGNLQKNNAFQEVIRNNGKDEPRVCFRAYEKEEPNARSSDTRASQNNSPCDGMETKNTGRQWETLTSSTIPSCEHTRMGNRICCSHQDSTSIGPRIPNVLQDRYRQPYTDGWYRGRRRKSQFIPKTITGFQEAEFLGIARVDDIAIQELRNRSQLESLCPNGFVYNIEVEENHNYFAEGILVHNCHHVLQSNTYGRVLGQLGSFSDSPNAPITLGVTATPERGDKKNIGKVWQEIVYQKDLLWAIEQGYLSDLRAVQVKLEIDLGDIRVRNGDFVDGDLAEAMMEADAPEHIVAAYMEHGENRKAIVFTPTVSVAYALAEEFRKNSYTAEGVDGTTPREERHAIQERFRSGETQIMTNCGIFTEGWDEPSLECIILARPTKSRVFYIQAVGRGTRLYPGKSDCLILDCVGSSSRHQIVTLASLHNVSDEELEETPLAEAVAKKRRAEEEIERVRAVNGKLIAETVDLFRRRDFHWITAGPDHFLLSLGEESLILEHTGEGLWSIIDYYGPTDRRLIAEGLTLEWAQGRAEELARQSRAQALFNPNAPWRSDPMTDNQARMLRRYRIKIPANGMTKGQASDAISIAKTMQAFNDKSRIVQPEVITLPF